MKKLGLVVVLGLLAAAVWWFVGRGPGGAGGSDAPLAYVPADTPYLFANLEPLPRPVIDKAMQQSAELMGLYSQLFEQMRADLEKSDKPEDRRVLALLDALQSEFRDKTPQQIVDSIGIGVESRMALYGIGVVPVLRMQVANPDNLRAFIGRMEKAAGSALPTATLDGVSYWTVHDDSAPLAGIAAMIGDQLVLTVAPAKAEPAVLRTLLGLDKPAQSAAASGSLVALNRDYGYLPYFSGYIDSARLLAALQADSAVDRAFLAALGTQRPELDATCAKELGELATAWPRASVGYEVFEAERNVSRFVLETRPDIAAELMKLRAPMPGLGSVGDEALLSLGISLKLANLPGVVGGFAGKVGAAPWQCAELAPLNVAFGEAAKNVNNPAVFAAAPVFSGLHVILHSFEMAPSADATPTGTGVLLIGSDNPASLIGMAKGLAPPLADLELPTDGSVVALPAMPGMPAGLTAHAAASENVIAIGIGGDAIKDSLPGMLKADPAQQPLFAMGLNSGFYVKLAEMMTAGIDEADADAAQLKAQAELLRKLYTTMFLRIDSRIELTEKGIEFRQLMLQR